MIPLWSIANSHQITIGVFLSLLCMNALFLTNAFRASRQISIAFWKKSSRNLYCKSILRDSSHYVGQLERSLPKLPSRGEGRNLLEYIMSVLLPNFQYFIEKSSTSWLEFGLPRGRTLGTKSAEKCYHVGTLEAFYLWSWLLHCLFYLVWILK